MHTHPLHYCVVQGYDQARHSVASVMAVLGYRSATLASVMVGLLGWRGATLASVMAGCRDATLWLLVWGCWADAGAP